MSKTLLIGSSSAIANSLQEILRGSLIASIASSIVTVIIALLTDTFAWWFLGGLFFSLLIFFKYLQSVIISYLDQTKVNVASMIAHFGFGMLIMTISLNAALSSEKTFSMKTGSSAIFADYNFTFDNLSKKSLISKPCNIGSLNTNLILEGYFKKLFLGQNFPELR